MPFSTAVRALSVVSLAVLIGACGARAHCTGERPYQTADTVDVLRDVENIRVPRSSSALIVPEEPLEGPAYAERYEDDDGGERIRCLDAPPRMDPLADDAA